MEQNVKANQEKVNFVFLMVVEIVAYTLTTIKKNVKMVQYLDMIFVLLMVDILNVIINIKMGNNVKHQLVKDITNVKNTEQDHVLEY
jgi:DNA integrity scanning protein DisA with diadenylate cyclase activity